MAMVQCPNCGNQISDKAAKCPHCGCEFSEGKKFYCVECGAELETEATVCSKCGCPVEKEQPSPQQVEVTGVKIKPKIKKIIIGALAVCIVFGICFLLYSKAQQQNATESYEENLNSVTYTMLSGASEAETCGNLIRQVWYNAIYEERDSTTDKYTRPKGYFVSDFNEALHNLFLDEDFSAQLESIEDNQSMVQLLMKELKNPPAEYEEAYDAVSEFYDAYVEFTNLVTSPSGSLQTFTTNFNDADSAVLNCYNAMSLYL